MNPGLVLFLTILGFAFILWYAGGGHNWPISSQGPFITPITNYGQQQYGYGPQLMASTTVSLPNGASVSAKVGNTSAAPTSSYKGSIVLARSSVAAASNPNQKYLEFTITSQASSPITLGNWKFVSVGSQTAVFITGTATTIDPGQTLLIVSQFPSTDTHDTIQLYDSSGALVASTSF